MRNRILRIAVVLLFIINAVSFGRAALRQSEGAAGTEWQAKHEAGGEAVKKGTKMKVKVTQEKIILQPEKGSEFFVPVANIAEVTYDNRAQRRTKESVALMAASPLAGAILMGFAKIKHYVNIVTEENGMKKETIIELGKNDYTGFLNELERVTGKEHKDLALERVNTQKEIMQEKDKKVAVKLDRLARVSDVDLKPGLYQVVFLERQGGKGDLYFFAGKKVDPNKIAAMTQVEVFADAAAAAVEVSYKQDGATTSIAEIKSQSKAFRFQ